MHAGYDAILIVSFGGPEKMDDVIPFLENVLRGKNVPRERLLEVAGHYEHFQGVSPINAHVRALIAALKPELAAHNLHLPIFWGNRNWHPLLADTICDMARAGVRRALAFVTSAYASYSGCRQYLEDIERARLAAGRTAPVIDKLRGFFNHPLFIEASADRLRAALGQLPAERRAAAPIVFTAHSIPESMAQTCAYVAQLHEACRLVTAKIGVPPDQWRLVYQSRSGRPQDPWLGPDVCDHLRALHATAISDVVLMPIGFLSDHLEVLYDLDVEAGALCHSLGLNLVRAATVGNHPRMIQMIRELIEERLNLQPERRAVGSLPPCADACATGCCPPPVRR